MSIISNKDKKQTSYLTVLICYTFLAIALGAEIILNGISMMMLVQLAAKLVICWTIHFIKKIPYSVEKWISYALLLHGFLIYGMTPAHIMNLTPLTVGLIALYYAVEMYELIVVSTVVYFVTVIGNLLLHSKDFTFTPSFITSLVLGGIFVCLAAYVAKLLRERRAGETKEMVETIERLEEENRRTEDFLTNVSHELRTPINAVTGLTAVMLKNEEDADKRENLISVQKAGYRLFGQIEDILDYTEIDTGRITVSDDTYMLSSLINDIISEQNMTEGKENLELIFDIEAKIPAVLVGDSKKIKKIIKHLVDNAVKFTEEGGIYVRIYALKKSYGVNLCIQVKDTGIGMDAESLSKITERFYQSSGGRDRRAGGLGLGLPIVYGMAAVMNGFVHVESKAGSGTEVTVSIPQKVADESAGMKVENPSKLCLACYLMPEKYKVPEVRKFYDGMITNIARGLDVAVHRVFSPDELEKLVSMYRLTHLFLADEEYEADSEYIENLDSNIQVVLIADENYRPKENSRVKILHKPFYCFPVVNILNSDTVEELAIQGRRMVCPDVKVLVVDDEPMNRMVAEGMLKDYQITVRTAGSGMEAISICENEEFDVLFLDHMMPEMDGVETLKQLRRLKTGSADMFTAIAFTANAVSGAREMFLREGFDEFLSKPVEAPELERVLRKVLPKARIKFIEERETVRENQSFAEQKQSQQENRPDEIAALEAAGINTAAALGYCRNDREFYVQLLRKFVSDADYKAGEINKYFGKGDYENYRIQVHALKSSAKMMGADQLSNSAKDMETAAKDKDIDYILANHNALMEMYANAANTIGEAIGAVQSEDEADPEGTEITQEEFLSYLDELRACFDTYEADKAQNLISELSKTVYGGKSVRSLLQKIKRDVDDFEYETAAERTSTLAEKVKGGETL